MAADWTAIKTEYVHGSSSMRELSAKHGIKPAGVMRRAAKEGWDSLRKQKSAEISKRASQSLTDSGTSALVEFNAADLQVARALRSNVAKQIQSAQMAGGLIEPNDLRSLASAAEAAQRIGRLALGVATERTASTATVAVVNVEMSKAEFRDLAREMAGRI